MSDIVRFSVSIEGDLLGLFDKYCQQEQFATRSEAVRQLIRDTLMRREWESGVHEVAGSLTLIYDHHRSQLRDQLIELQHDHTDLIVSTLHAHLTHDVCMEVIVLRGPAAKLQQIASRLKGLKGIHKGELVMASAQGGQARSSDEAAESEPGNRCEENRCTEDSRQVNPVKRRKASL